MRRPRATSAIAGLLVASALAGCPKKLPPPPAPAPAPAPPPGPIDPSACQRALRIEVRKSERRLTADCVVGGYVAFPIALSREPGPKRARGDLRMPEGDYAIAGPAHQSRFHLFVPIDYPSRADADRALAEGRIDRGTRDAIASAHAHGRMPPQDTALGGALGLHGEGARWRGDLALDWTEGCIALSDRAIEQLARLVWRGTPVRILP
jgi:L,D-transpeptidase catalytic domain